MLSGQQSRRVAMVDIILISASDPTLLQVNHVTTDTNVLSLNFLCSRWESQSRTGKSKTHRAFLSVDTQRSLSKLSLCGINFLSLLEAVSFIIPCQKEKAINAEGSEDFYMFPTSLFSCTKQDQMFQTKLKLKSHYI